MKMFMLGFALILVAAPGMALAMGDRVLSDLVATGSVVHPHGITGGK